jgi:hypothetical protein
MPNIYSFSESITLQKLIEYLLTSVINYKIVSQVMNYDNKIIGLVVENKQNKHKGFVPCYPASQITSDKGPEINTIFVDDVYTTSYEKTKIFLEELHSIAKKSEIKIPCKPYMKVLEDGLIVGILTISNQFVMITANEAALPIEDDLISINSSNYNNTDKTIVTSNKVDEKRAVYINNIRLETQFYNVFRNTARYLLGQYINADIRKDIEEKVNSSDSYLKKLNSIEHSLRDLMKNNITFHSYSAAELLKLKKITSCYINCNNSAYCKKDSNGDCLLMVPDINLINQKENNLFYYGKLADEIVRYIRVNSFIFNPKTLISFSKINYDLRDNEIILLQSLLTQEYFENIETSKENKYIHSNVYDNTNPLIKQNYSNVETAIIHESMDEPCEIKIKNYITSGIFKKMFTSEIKEYNFIPNTNKCSFEIIIRILKDYGIKNKKGGDISIYDIKDILIQKYSEFLKLYKNKALDILSRQGKTRMIKRVEKNEIKFADLIQSDTYFMSSLDIWILAVEYNIPLIMMNMTSLQETDYKKRIMTINVSPENSYYFLQQSGVDRGESDNGKPTIYSLFADKNDNFKIPLDKLIDLSVVAEIKRGDLNYKLDDFIKNFSKEKDRTAIKKIKPIEVQTQAQAPRIEEEPQPQRRIEEEPQPQRLIEEEPQPQPQPPSRIKKNVVKLNKSKVKL